MKILITNDDGITSEGIIRLARTARKFGDVLVVAPEKQRSAASHSITLHSHVDIVPHDFRVEGVKAWSCSGTPADCVRVGHRYLYKGETDLVLSGINHGYNVATDIQYSATAGAAFEASFQGIHGIALSEGPGGCHEVTDAYLEDVLRELLPQKLPVHEIWNVNFPDCPLSDFQGILRGRTVSCCNPFDDDYILSERLENGGERIVIADSVTKEAEEGSDFHAVLHRCLSIGTVKNIG